jgi:hypothetical protein
MIDLLLRKPERRAPEGTLEARKTNSLRAQHTSAEALANHFEGVLEEGSSQTHGLGSGRASRSQRDRALRGHYRAGSPLRRAQRQSPPVLLLLSNAGHLRMLTTQQTRILYPV